MSLPEALDAAVGAWSDGDAMVCDGERETLEHIRRNAEEVGQQLAAMEVRPHERVAILVPNGLRFVHVLFGIARLGAVAVPLDVRSPAAELAELLRSARVSAVVVDADQPAAASDRSLEDVTAELVGRRRTLIVRDHEFKRLRGEREDATVAGPASINPDDLAVVFCTSGTTGRPKLIEHSHRAVVTSILGLHRLHASFFDGTASERIHRVATVLRRHGRRALQARGRQVWMTAIGFNSVSGQQVLLGALLGGHRLVTMRSFHPRVALELIHKERVNILAATPSMAELLLSVKGVDNDDFSSMLIVGLGGGPVSPELATRVQERFGCGVGVGYGSTELGGGVLVSRLEDPLDVQTGTVGRPFPGAEVEVVDDGGRQVGTGQVGELTCRVQGLPELGWYATGDLARRDARGNVSIVGRKTEMIVRRDQNVYPAEVERVLDSLPAIERSAVLGVSGPSGEQVWAFVVMTQGSRSTTRDVMAHCRDRLAAYKIPDHIVVRTTLPTTADGKVQKFRLAEEASASLAARR